MTRAKDKLLNEWDEKITKCRHFDKFFYRIIRVGKEGKEREERV